MAYRRPPRPNWYFDGKCREGYKQLSTGTPKKSTAQEMEQMWAKLALHHRAWDLLDLVLTTPARIGDLFDAWRDTKQDVEAMRRKFNDHDLEPVVQEWHEWMQTRGVCDAHTAKAHLYVRHFFPAGIRRSSSDVSTAWLTKTLTAYPAKTNTLRKVHSALSMFFRYVVVVKEWMPANPMDKVERPKVKRHLPVFYDTATALRIVAWQPDAVRRAFMALMYGTGADVSAALVIEPGHINAANHEVRIPGTKATGRDRIVRLNGEMWPTFWKHARTVIAGSIFPATWSRWTVSDWHRQTVGDGVKDTHGRETPGLKLSKRLPLRMVRHHFAVRLLQAGAPIRVVAEQLGDDERTVLKHYGTWLTSAEDRARAEAMATQHEQRRVAASE